MTAFIIITLLLLGLCLWIKNRVIQAAFITVLLIALVFFGTQIVGMTGLGRQSIDLTEDDRYTLTDGTKSILAELSEPVTINYYVTRDLRSVPAGIKRFIPRVDNLLDEFEALAKNDNLTINFIDPKPNTDEEDAAQLDQIQRVPISQDEELFFGASISAWDKKTVIPYFDPQNETQLEFELISAIAEVSKINKPVVGLVTSLSMDTGGQTGQGWVFHQYLQRSYKVANLDMGVVDNLPDLYDENEWGEAPSYLDPEKIPVVLVVHPAGITEEAEYHLDQYLLRGGTVVAAVDAFSYAAQAESQQQRPMMPGMPPQGGVPTESTLPKLFAKHGVTFSGNKVIIDGKYGQPDNQRQAGNPGVLSLDKEALPNEDDLAMASVNDLFMIFAGAFEDVKPEGLNYTSLVKSSTKSSLVDSSEVANPQGAENLRFKLRSSDRQYDLAVYMNGNFPTAFPDGDPSAPKEEEKEDKKDEEKSDSKKTEKEEEKAEPKSDSLKEATGAGHLYLFADTDFLFDGAAYRVLRIAGMQGGGIPQQISDNAPLIFNILDQATNSKHLVGARARTPSWRPFTVFKEMQAEFREKAGKEIDKFREQQKAASDRINAIQAQRKDQNSAFLNPEQAAELKKLQEDEVKYAKSIREKEKEYQASEDAIKSGIFWKSFLTVPCIVILLGLGVYLFRRMFTQAR